MSLYEELARMETDDALELNGLIEDLGNVIGMRYERQVSSLEDIEQFVPVLLLPCGNAFTVYTVQIKTDQGIVFRALGGPTSPFGSPVFAFYPQAYATLRYGESNYRAFKKGAYYWRKS